MFPQLRERFGPALDLIVEFSTLGEYRLGADGALWPASALALAPEREPQLGGAGAFDAERAAVRRIVAGGAVGRVPAVTPAAWRPTPRPEHPAGIARGRPAPPKSGPCRGERRHPAVERRPSRPARQRKPIAPEQLCFAV